MCYYVQYVGKLNLEAVIVHSLRTEPGSGLVRGIDLARRETMGSGPCPELV